MTAFTLTQEAFARYFQPGAPVNYRFPSEGDTGRLHVITARVESVFGNDTCLIAFLYIGTIRRTFVPASALSIRRTDVPELDGGERDEEGKRCRRRKA